MEGQTSSQPPPGSNQDEEDPPKLDLPEQLQKIVPAAQLPHSLNRWNTNEEIASVLIAFDRHKEWLLDKPRIRPPSGSLLMYNRKKVMFRRDGYCWKKRRDGKTNREDHMKLKVKGVECIYGSYVHSAILPTFHRRCYWLLQNPHVVLVHYLNVPNPPNNPKPSLVHSLSGEMRKKEWTKEELVDQLRPMLASDRQGELNPDQDQKVEETLEAIFQLLVNSQEESGAKSLSADSSHHHPCRAAVVAAASSFISDGDAVGLNSGLAASHTDGPAHQQCGSQPIVKQEVGMVCVQQQGHHLGGCVSTMAHMQVTANTLPPPHQHHIQPGLTPQTAISTAVVPVLSPPYNTGGQAATSGLQQVQPTGIPTTTVSTSLSQLTLATFSHVHLASSSSTLPSVSPSEELHHLHQPPLTPNTPLPSSGIPSSVSFLSGLASPDPSKLVHSGHKSGMVHLCPTGLVLKDSGGLGSVVAFASTPTPCSSTTQFGSMTQVAHTRTHPQPLPGPSKDIPLFAANPLTQCGDDNGCEDTTSCADENGIRNVNGSGGGGGSVGADVVCLPDAGDNCDTLDGSFSSLPSTDLNLDLFLDLQDLEDCAADLAAATSLSPPHFPPSPSSPIGASSCSHQPLATSSPLMSGGSGNVSCSSNSVASVLPVSHPHSLDVMSGSYLNHMTSPNAQLSPGVNHNTKQPLVARGAWESATVGHSSTDCSGAPALTHTSNHQVISQHVLSNHEVKMEGSGVIDVNSFLIHQAHVGGKTNISATSSTAMNNSICDFSPEWAYTKGHTKILVAGPWCNQSAVYTCVFDGKHVAASLVQPGVLRCFTPEHSSGCVNLQVAEDGVVVSDSKVFEFRDHDKPYWPQREQSVPQQADWFDVPSSQLKRLLLDRLGELQRRFISGDKSPSFCSIQNLGEDCGESGLVSHVELLTKQQWSTDHMYLKAGRNGLTLLHLASALGFAKLVSALIRWRSCNCSPALEIEVDAQSVDNQACTPLMWACAKGQIDAALTLYHWNGAAVGVCNKDGQLPLALARQRGHHNLATQVEQLEQAHFKTPAPAPAKIRCQNSELPNNSSSGNVETNCVPQPMSPDMVKVEQLEGDSNVVNQQSQPMQTCQLMSSASVPLPPLPPPSTTPGKLIRRFSEQVISPSASSSHHPLSKRYSVDLLTSSDTNSTTTTASTATSHMRDSTSEPRLPLKSEETELDGTCLERRTQRVPSLTFDLEPESSQTVRRKVPGTDRSFLSPLDRGQLPMDTDDGSGRSDSPFIDVERVSSDEEAEKQDDSKHQMVTLANQIIAAMPERIKLSPSKGDEEDDGCSIRTRSESHSSSAPSQGSPRPSSSSFGDDSGISTPMTDSLAFEEYRYTDFGTPASSLSPDSTCLPSPYSPYSFALDSPPPTTADFTEYFNAPTTYMEKDFSQLTLSDQEQRKLYEAAKVIQNAYRHYRDKQQQQQQQKEIEAAVLIQSYYRRYKQYAYYKKMTHAAVLIQNQFRSYSAQKRKKNLGGSTQGSRRELERLKKGRNQSVIIQQRFRSHYQRKSLDGKDGGAAMGVASGEAPDSSPQSEEVQQLAHELSPPVDGGESSTADATSAS